jgi:hypothetical protein
MNRKPFALYAVVIGIGVVGALLAGVSASTLLFLGVALACPLMMLFMHGGHGGGHDSHARSDRSPEVTDDLPTTGPTSYTP